MREMYEVPSMELVELKCEDVILSSIITDEEVGSDE